MRREKKLKSGEKEKGKAIFGKNQTPIPKNNIASVQEKLM